MHVIHYCYYVIVRLADGMVNKADKNMKRETKTYSYEDQVWEAKLKEELAMKKLGQQLDSDIKYIL